MNISSIEESLELNGIYCLCILSIFKKINADKMSLCNFLLRYPLKIRKIDEKLSDEGLKDENAIEFSIRWNSNVTNSIRILYAKKIINFDEENEIIYGEKATSAIGELEKYEEFDNLIASLKQIKKKIEKEELNVLVKKVNG